MGVMTYTIEWDADKVRALLGGVPPENLPDNEQIKFLLKANKGNGWWTASDILLGVVAAMGTSGQLDVIKADDFTLGGSEKTLDYLTQLAAQYRARGDEEEGAELAIVFPPDHGLGWV